MRGGFLFYEGQKQGVGDYFLESLQSDVRSLVVTAGVHEKCDGFHRMLGKRFPFAVYYLMQDDGVDIYAILDCRRSPSWTSDRLKGRLDDEPDQQ